MYLKRVYQDKSWNRTRYLDISNIIKKDLVFKLKIKKKKKNNTKTKQKNWKSTEQTFHKRKTTGKSAQYDQYQENADLKKIYNLTCPPN